jgi:(R,R)-butanediol dehydrogenase/meso-butanediol dehydrogenase/diacetyl reductase/L-iditol 2-dehydrogenase
MRGICYTVPGYGCYDIPEPQIKNPDDVKVRMAYTGICGSDIHIIKGELDFFIGVKPGDKRVIGHEGCGYVTELGPKATRKGLKVGDKVCFYYNYHCNSCHYCRSGKENFCLNTELRDWVMSDYVIFSEQQVFKLPEDADMKRAALIEPVTVTLHGIDLCNIRPGTSVLIIGAGGIGLLMVQLAKMSGGVNITVSEPVEGKRRNALALGAEHAIDPFKEDFNKRVKEISGGLGFDVVIEASGAPPAVKSAWDALARGGALELFATYSEGINLKDIPLSGLNALSFKEARVLGIFQSPYMFPRAIEVYKRLNLDLFIEHIFKPEDCKKAFETQMTGVPQKVLFDFN